jgi:hypothetical protein
VDVRHHVVAQFAFLHARQVEVDVVHMLAHLRDLLGANRQAHLVFRLQRQQRRQQQQQQQQQ